MDQRAPTRVKVEMVLQTLVVVAVVLDTRLLE
jgi:hypothetical protein